MKKIKKIITRIVFCGEVCLFSYLYLFGKYGLCQLIHVKQETMQVQEKIAAIEQEIKNLEHDIYCWQHAPFYKEKCAREELDMARPGDQVYYIR